MATAQHSLSMKLLVDNKTNKVLFAEAGKDVIDYLMITGLLAIPVGSIAKLLNKEWMDGCIGNLYKSIETIDDSYITSILNVKGLRCGCANYFTDVHGIRCPDCSTQMTTEISYVGPDPISTAAAVANALNGGFVKRYKLCVMDDLTFTPMSTITSVTMLNKFHVKDVGSLEERNVNVGMKEGVELLVASRRSKTVLTDVFIRKKFG